MKKLFLLIFFLSAVAVSGCAVTEGTVICDAQTPCPEGYTCDLAQGACVQNQVSGEDTNNIDGDTAQPSDSDIITEGSPDLDQTVIVNCTPGETAECYTGPSGTKNVGLCKAGKSTCNFDGSAWSNCEGMVTPVPEICDDGIDQNCDGKDASAATATDIDGDGFTYCSGDCCETPGECPDPAKTNPDAFELPSNGVDDNCNGQIDEVITCDSGLVLNKNDVKGNALALAKAMGVCDFLVSAELGLAGPAAYEDIKEGPNSGDPSQNPNPTKHRLSLPSPYYDDKYQTYAVPEKFGNVMGAPEGERMAVLSTGPWNKPTANFNEATLDAGDMKTCSQVPSDWINTQQGCAFPASPSCENGTITTEKLSDQCSGKGIPTVQDPIMLTLKLKVPINAVAFRFKIFFLSIEFPQFACMEYNDFAIVLLDSTYNDKNPASNNPNPWDKNIGKDDKGNPLGVNMAPNGLFQSCNTKCGSGRDNTNRYGSCYGDQELAGTGFESKVVLGICSGHGGTGWLTTQGNVVPGEEMTLRIAVWETGGVDYGPDHSYDDTVLLDKFEWLTSEAKPGTGIQN